MSWNFRKAGTNIEAMKAAVQKEFAPPSIKDEICARIDGIAAYPPSDGVPFVIIVDTNGHIETDDARPWKHVNSVIINVYTLPVIN